MPDIPDSSPSRKEKTTYSPLATCRYPLVTMKFMWLHWRPNYFPRAGLLHTRNRCKKTRRRLSTRTLGTMTQTHKRHRPSLYRHHHRRHQHHHNHHHNHHTKNTNNNTMTYKLYRTMSGSQILLEGSLTSVMLS